MSYRSWASFVHAQRSPKVERVRNRPHTAQDSLSGPQVFSCLSRLIVALATRITVNAVYRPPSSYPKHLIQARPELGLPCLIESPKP